MPFMNFKLPSRKAFGDASKKTNRVPEYPKMQTQTQKPQTQMQMQSPPKAAGLHQGLEIYNPAIHQEYTGDMDPHALQSFVDSQIASQLKSMGGTGQFQHMVPVPGSHFNEIENFGPDGEMTCDFDGSPIKMPRQQPMMQQPMMQQPMMQQPMQQRAPVQWAMQDLVSPDTSLAQPAEAMPNPAAAFSPSAVYDFVKPSDFARPGTVLTGVECPM